MNARIRFDFCFNRNFFELFFHQIRNVDDTSVRRRRVRRFVVIIVVRYGFRRFPTRHTQSYVTRRASRKFFNASFVRHEHNTPVGRHFVYAVHRTADIGHTDFRRARTPLIAPVARDLYVPSSRDANRSSVANTCRVRATRITGRRAAVVVKGHDARYDAATARVFIPFPQIVACVHIIIYLTA